MSQLKGYNDFRKGMNDTSSPDQLDDKELRYAQNVDLSERGGFSTREGTTKFNETSYNGEIEQEIEWYVKGVSKKLICLNNNLYMIKDDKTLQLLQALSGTRIYHFFLKDKMYFTDGVKYFVIDDTLVVKEVVANANAGNDIAPIKKCKYFLVHPKSLRIFASGNPDNPTGLYYSEPGDPTLFKATSIVYPVNSEGEITGLANLSVAVLVSYNTSWWKWTGIDPTTDAMWEMIPISQGCVSHDSIALTPNSLTFLGQDGIHMISASIIYQEIVMVKGEDMIKNITDGRLEKTIKSIKNPKKTKAVFHRNKYLLAYSDVGRDERNEKVIEYNWSTDGFSIHTGWQVNYWCKEVDGELSFASKNYILRAFNGLNDVDVNTGLDKAIEFDVEFKGYSLDMPFRSKFLKDIHFNFRQYNDEESFVDVSVIGDYEEILFNGVDLAESLIWGRKWGKIWGFVDLINQYAEINKKASRFTIRMKNNRLNDRITCYAIGFNYQPLRPIAERISNDRRLLS